MDSLVKLSPNDFTEELLQCNAFYSAFRYQPISMKDFCSLKQFPNNCSPDSSEYGETISHSTSGDQLPHSEPLQQFSGGHIILNASEEKPSGRSHVNLIISTQQTAGQEETASEPHAVQRFISNIVRLGARKCSSRNDWHRFLADCVIIYKFLSNRVSIHYVVRQFLQASLSSCTDDNDAALSVALPFFNVLQPHESADKSIIYDFSTKNETSNPFPYKSDSQYDNKGKLDCQYKASTTQSHIGNHRPSVSWDRTALHQHVANLGETSSDRISSALRKLVGQSQTLLNQPLLGKELSSQSKNFGSSEQSNFVPSLTNMFLDVSSPVADNISVGVLLLALRNEITPEDVTEASLGAARELMNSTISINVQTQYSPFNKAVRILRMLPESNPSVKTEINFMEACLLLSRLDIKVCYLT